MAASHKWMLWIAIPALLGTVSCQSESSDQHHREANTPAGKAGQVAYEAAKESGKVARVAARESGKVAKVAVKDLSKVAHDAHEGWKEASGKDKSKR